MVRLNNPTYSHVSWDEYRDEMYLVVGHGWQMYAEPHTTHVRFTHKELEGDYSMQEALAIQTSWDALED